MVDEGKLGGILAAEIWLFGHVCVYGTLMVVGRMRLAQNLPLAGPMGVGRGVLL